LNFKRPIRLLRAKEFSKPLLQTMLREQKAATKPMVGAQTNVEQLSSTVHEACNDSPAQVKHEGTIRKMGFRRRNGNVVF
jgi:hypothetical protein